MKKILLAILIIAGIAWNIVIWTSNDGGSRTINLNEIRSNYFIVKPNLTLQPDFQVDSKYKFFKVGFDSVLIGHGVESIIYQGFNQNGCFQYEQNLSNMGQTQKIKEIDTMAAKDGKFLLITFCKDKGGISIIYSILIFVACFALFFMGLEINLWYNNIGKNK
ncbi:MAG: hypothetical protein WC499_01460 [Patescibacteria group bacterium]